MSSFERDRLLVARLVRMCVVFDRLTDFTRESEYWMASG
jgi:hypothetical protein